MLRIQSIFFAVFVYLPILVVALAAPVVSLAQAQSMWHNGAPLPQAVSGAVAASIGDKVYVLSGTVGTGIRRFFEVYDTRGDGWRPLPPMPVDRVQFGVAAGAGQIIVTGGGHVDSTQISDDVWMFSPSHSLWTQMPAMPNRRAGHASAVIGDTLYVVGGIGAAAAHIYAYQLNQRQWKVLPKKMPIPASQIAMVAYGNELVIVGGRDKNGRAIAAVQIYNTKSGTWRRAADLPSPRSGVAIGMLGNRLHVVGGYAELPPKTLDEHYTLDMSKTDANANSRKGVKWRRAALLPQARHHAGYAALPNGFYVFGGALGGGFYAPFTATDIVHIFRP